MFFRFIGIIFISFFLLILGDLKIVLGSLRLFLSFFGIEILLLNFLIGLK